MNKTPKFVFSLLVLFNIKEALSKIVDWAGGLEDYRIRLSDSYLNNSKLADSQTDGDCPQGVQESTFYPVKTSKRYVPG